MSFRYRTIGYSPEYAITTSLTENQFHNANSYESDSTITLKLGSTTLAQTGALLRVTDAPTNGLDVVNKTYADTKIPLAGGTMTGLLVLSGDPSAALNPATKQYTDLRIHKDGSVAMTGQLTLVGDPVAASDAARKAYVDTKLPLAGGTMTGYITLHDHPSTAFQAATKAYVDGRLSLVDAGDGLYKTQSVQTKTGTFSQTLNDITVTTVEDHGFAAGTVVNLTFTAGNPSNPANGLYAVVSTSGTKVFIVTAADSVSRTGNASAAVTLTGISVSSVGAGQLQVNADDISLKITNPTASTTTWYDQVKVDAYGRVSAAQATPLVSATDGWYTRLRVQGGYVTQAESIAYITGNQTITLSGDATGSGTTALDVQLTNTGVAAGQYTKVTVNAKGRVTSATSLSSSDVTNALGYVPPRGSTVELLTLAGSHLSNSWGTSPITSLTVSSGGITGATVSGQYLYIPRGIYHITFYGSNNWWQRYYASWWYYSYWWGNYWTYYYQPSAIYLNGAIQTAAFSNYGGWWWYWNSKYHSSKAQDFCLNDTIQVTTDGSYFQFGLPMLAGISYWYNIKIVKLG